MPKIHEFNTPTAQDFFSILESLYPDSVQPYQCSVLSDLDYVALGASRCLGHAKTGHKNNGVQSISSKPFVDGN